VADCEAAKVLLDHLPTAARVLHGDKGYDTNPHPAAGRGERHASQHPAQGQSGLEDVLLAVLYRARNAIERMFCRLKDFRRIATRYDRLATNFLAAVCLAATVSYWL
jgi:transposase